MCSLYGTWVRELTGLLWNVRTDRSHTMVDAAFASALRWFQFHGIGYRDHRTSVSP